jgi:hypothetical protein
LQASVDFDRGGVLPQGVFFRFFSDIPQGEASIFTKIFEEQEDWVCQVKNLRAASRRIS